MRPKKGTSNLLQPDFLLLAYCSGYFPMADSTTGEIDWYSPDPRAIFELDEFHIPRSLQSVVKSNKFEVTIDRDFESTIRACADRDETWISPEIIKAYCKLHEAGFAHSVETWQGGTLAGGLYGVAVRGAFFGESMFSRVRDASKVALVYLVRRLKERGFELLDTQFITPHLARFGAKDIPRVEYLQRLNKALLKQASFV
ncbi:MAG TPA: leucyl/phenylalanyl-tRNA--protein transferase [Bacteroidota bacterium]|nr:leucyl/phenylalanyl-tRNA--protein transferase [Bacteroidota bacterium]